MSDTLAGYRGRFAPSPTGPLHLGSLVAALGSWLDARHHRGEWLIRIEDLDPPRERPGAAALQLRTLAACGLHSDRDVVYQSQRSELYEQALQRLAEAGLSFACSCSRRTLQTQGGIHHRCVQPIQANRHAVRLRVETRSIELNDRLRGHWLEDPWTQHGDFVLKRADGLYAYQLAVVVEDAEQGVTDVVRGVDLLDSLSRQALLHTALNLPRPRYLHLPLVLDEHGHKLSKSLSALPIDANQPLPALRRAWQLLGQGLRAVADATSVDAFLRAAMAAYQPQRIPARELSWEAVQPQHIDPATA